MPCLVLNPITVHNYALPLIARRWHGSGVRLKTIYFSWLGLELFRLLLGPPWFNLLQIFSDVVLLPRDLQLPGIRWIIVSSFLNLLDNFRDFGVIRTLCYLE